MNDVRRRLDPDGLGDHVDRLYRAAWGLCGNREEAEDLVQETYARVLARPRFLRNDDDLGYLLRALRNTFALQLRKKKRQIQGQEVSAENEPEDPRRHMQPEHEIEARELFAAIAELPEDFRSAIVAVDVTGLSCEEASKALRVPAGTIRSRLFRGRERLIASLSSDAGKRSGTKGRPRSLAW